MPVFPGYHQLHPSNLRALPGFFRACEWKEKRQEGCEKVPFSVSCLLLIANSKGGRESLGLCTRFRSEETRKWEKTRERKDQEVRPGSEKKTWERGWSELSLWCLQKSCQQEAETSILSHPCVSGAPSLSQPWPLAWNHSLMEPGQSWMETCWILSRT